MGEQMLGSGATAKIDGAVLTVKLPLWQIILLLGGGTTVIFSVWLATRDLGAEVTRLSANVSNLTAAVDNLHGATDSLKDRVIRLEAINGIRSQDPPPQR